MAAFLTTNASLTCPHGGTVSVVTSNVRAKAAGGAILRSSDTFVIAGCAFAPAGAAHPCVNILWVTPSARNKADGGASLTDESVGMCTAADGAAQGAALVQMTQARVTGI